MFTLASQIHSHNTRNSSLFYIPPCRTNFRKFSIRFQGPTFFNLLSREIQNSESISLFGRRLKKILSFLVKYTLFWATYIFSFFSATHQLMYFLCWKLQVWFQWLPCYGVNSLCFPILLSLYRCLDFAWCWFVYWYLFYCVMDFILLIVSHWVCWCYCSVDLAFTSLLLLTRFPFLSKTVVLCLDLSLHSIFVRPYSFFMCWLFAASSGSSAMFRFLLCAFILLLTSLSFSVYFALSCLLTLFLWSTRFYDLIHSSFLFRSLPWTLSATSVYPFSITWKSLSISSSFATTSPSSSST